MSALTHRQQDILDFIAEYTNNLGYPPSTRNIALACQLSSTSHVVYELRKLRSMGLVDWVPGKARTLRVMGKSQ